MWLQVCAGQSQQRDHDHTDCVDSGNHESSNVSCKEKMRDDLVDKAEVLAFRGVFCSVSWLLGQVSPDVFCLVSKLPQTLTQHTAFQVCDSSMVMHCVHQHADLDLKIRRIPVQNMMFLLHVNASLNTDVLVNSQGGNVGGDTCKSSLEGCNVPWSPMAWRSFKMSRTAPISLNKRAPLAGEVCLLLQKVDVRARKRGQRSREVCVRTLPQPIGRAASSGTVSLSQVVQREEFNYIENLIRLLGSQSWWTAVWCFSLAMVAVFLFILFLVCYQC